jgi:RNA polymerase sigma-70 factor (ECF subfamily)
LNPLPTYTEYELVSLLKAKDGKVFNYLYQKYGGGIYNIIFQIIPDSDLASDLVQETFIQIWNKIDSYDSTKGRLFTWMLHIARNLSIDMLRSKGYRNKLKTQEAPENEDEGYYGAKVLVMPDALLNSGLKKAVQLLKPQYRDIIELVYFQGYTQAEVAEMQGTPLGTVKTRIRNALVQLKDYLSEHP